MLINIPSRDIPAHRQSALASARNLSSEIIPVRRILPEPKEGFDYE